MQPRWIWECNWTAVRVFSSCHWDKTVVAGLGPAKTLFLGIRSQEIAATCLAMRVPRAEWPDVLWAVKLMAGAAAKVLNAAKE